MTQVIGYKLLKKITGVEIRSYPSLNVAYTLIAETEDGEAKAVQRLIDYTSFDNKQGKYIGMLYPILFYEKDKKSQVAFILKDTALKKFPAANNALVKLEKQKARTLATTSFLGNVTAEKIAAKQDFLFKQLLKNKIIIKGQSMVLYYSKNIIFPFLRKNEVAVEVLL